MVDRPEAACGHLDRVVGARDVTRSAEKDAPPAVDATLMPSPPIVLILVSLTSTEAAALNATSMPCVVKP